MELRDFTFEQYERLLEAIDDAGYEVLPVASYLSDPDPPGQCVVLRHDVDRRVSTARAMARLEAEHDVRSTYYLRTSTFDPSTARELSGMGHEVGYHYETLARTRGDHGAAVERFVETLSRFREHVDVGTIVAHGSPLSPQNNLALWDGDVSPSDFDLLGEAYLALDGSDGGDALPYVSDTGRTWNSGPVDVDESATNTDEPTGTADVSPVATDGGTLGPVRTTDDLITFVETGPFDQLYILAHPSRWSRSRVDHARSVAWDLAAESGKRLVGPTFALQRGVLGVGASLRRAAAVTVGVPRHVVGLGSEHRNR